jgi:hypothetical protein
VFTLSAILHEMLVGIPTHNFIGMSFLSGRSSSANEVQASRSLE